MAQNPEDIFLGNTKPLKTLGFDEEEPLRKISLDDSFQGAPLSTEIGSLFVPKVLTPFTREQQGDVLTMSEEGKLFLKQEMARAEAEKQSSVENFFNAGYKSLVTQSKAAYLELFGYHDEALEVIQ